MYKDYNNLKINKRGDQALISISTIIKLSAQDVPGTIEDSCDGQYDPLEK